MLFSSDSNESNDAINDYNNRVSKSAEEKTSLAEDTDYHNYDNRSIGNKHVEEESSLE